jgi:hypothetical protein
MKEMKWSVDADLLVQGESIKTDRYKLEIGNRERKNTLSM